MSREKTFASIGRFTFGFIAPYYQTKHGKLWNVSIGKFLLNKWYIGFTVLGFWVNFKISEPTLL